MDKNKDNAFSLALRYHPHLIPVLLASKCEVTSDIGSAIINAIYYKSEHAVSLIQKASETLEGREGLNSWTLDNKTAFFLALETKQFEVARELAGMGNSFFSAAAIASFIKMINQTPEQDKIKLFEIFSLYSKNRDYLDPESISILLLFQNIFNEFKNLPPDKARSVSLSVLRENFWKRQDKINAQNQKLSGLFREIQN